ncbi:LytTR family transcriptional regulator DNA-binding domain-containing protein [Tissierella pigra]|uniref:LytTR family transcriptional regulator n=1 Tax=Tissierella pigra TaxID=2607614 RepID=A0A6N7XVZ3_9FIRM|nr:LytTR family DNA-binding domain-containing protein [Tissierella pigra]MBU5425984.1 LytTR family transcriptional regulator DNA-binding domain-containing protein [Tissierella pigra]MSU00655.1 LytTR family transcriptional regulator [Tissierella pigra]
MIIKLEENPNQKELEVSIKCTKIDKKVKRIVSLIRSVDNIIKCSLENQETWIDASYIYYIESVDKKTFVYCEKSVYRTEFRLYQLLEQLSSCDFVQISKSCILNLNVLDSIRPLVNSRLEATLINGERLYITRKYLAEIKLKLQER